VLRFLVFLSLLSVATLTLDRYGPPLRAAAADAAHALTLPFEMARLAAQPPDTALLMPVAGVRVSQVADTWGAPRSGGRRHEGQDIFAPRGTPIFSATSGYVVRITDATLGGNSAFVLGAGGRRYYYTHLDEFAEGLAVGDRVTVDTVLGYVGNTGNAAGTPPHLHFGVYGSAGALDPLPLLVDRP
jgi:peptidoglycan LD-endopeptidase LytH